MSFPPIDALNWFHSLTLGHPVSPGKTRQEEFDDGRASALVMRMLNSSVLQDMTAFDAR
jgi:hypothetical protein